MRFLVVEDLVDQAESLKSLLEVSGHQVAVAYSAGAARSLVELHPPEVVVLDFMMPGAGGFKFLLWLRGGGKTANTPVVVSTALPPSALPDLAGLGPLKVLTKPYPVEELLAAAAALLPTP